MDCTSLWCFTPIIAQRVAMGNKMFGSEKQPDDLEQVMKELYFDLAGKVLPYQLPTLLEMVDKIKLYMVLMHHTQRTK